MFLCLSPSLFPTNLSFQFFFCFAGSINISLRLVRFALCINISLRLVCFTLCIYIKVIKKRKEKDITLFYSQSSGAKAESKISGMKAASVGPVLMVINFCIIALQKIAQTTVRSFNVGPSTKPALLKKSFTVVLWEAIENHTPR